MSVWVQGARPRTLVAAVCPVLVGTAAAAAEGPVVAWRALAALVVALALQVGVNYANDYSDGLAGVQQLAGDATLLFYMTEEAQEGRDAFREKRRPNYQ